MNEESFPQEKLCQLIKKIHQARAGSKESENAIEALTYAIDQIPEIKAKLGSGWLTYYDEALPTTMKDVKKNFREFFTIYKKLDFDTLNCDEELSIQLVNKTFVNYTLIILRRDCHDVYRRNKKRNIKEISFEDPLGENGKIEDLISSPDLEGLEKLINKEKQQENKDKLEKLNSIFQKFDCYPGEYFSCTCYELILRKLLTQPPQTFKLIAQELAVPQATLASHWRRKCQPKIDKVRKENL